MKIRDIVRKPLGEKDTCREGRVYVRLWDTDIAVFLFEEVTLDYAQKCADAMNSMSEDLIGAICRSARLFCLTFFEEISDEWREELELSVPVDADTPPLEMLRYFRPMGLVVEPPLDPGRIGYQLKCSCDWDEENGLEIDILDGKMVGMRELSLDVPRAGHSYENWNFAAHMHGTAPEAGENREMNIRWEDGFVIRVSKDGQGAVISANREGLLSLAMQLRDLAEEAPGCHIHYDEGNSLEEGSCDLIIERIE